MKKEERYEFRKKLLTVHESGIRDFSLTPSENEVALFNGAMVNILCKESEHVRFAAEDFVDFLSVSMGISAMVTVGGDERGGNTVTLLLAEDSDARLAEADGYKGFLIDANDGIRIYGYDVRMEFKT